MKLWKQLLILAILDLIIIGAFVIYGDPDPSASIGIIILVPIAAIINLIFAWLAYNTKRNYTNAFLLNTIISSILMYYLFTWGITRHQKKRYEGWNFNISDTVFRITHSKMDNTFSITYSTDPGSSWSLIDGRFIKRQDSYVLATDSTQYIIRNNYLFGFRDRDSLKLIDVDY